MRSDPPIVAYTPDYRVSFFGIERLHPFDIGKMDTIAQHLRDEGLVAPDGFAEPTPADDEALSAVHDPAYLESLHALPTLARALEVWVPDVFPVSVVEARVRRPFRTAAAGTVCAARSALSGGLGINLGGGFHHAHPAMGHGFCIYNDVALAVHAIRGDGFSGRVLVVDTDAHQGDGNHACFQRDPTVYTLSIHQDSLFPWPKVPGDLDVPLPSGATDESFTEALAPALDRALEASTPALIVHVAGADVLHDDPLTGLQLTNEGLIARDDLVYRAARARGVPLVVVLAGGVRAERRHRAGAIGRGPDQVPRGVIKTSRRLLGWPRSLAGP